MNDLRFAFRQLRKSPGFTSVAVLTLALGIGACTAIFSLVETVLLRPLPYPETGRVMSVMQQFKGTRNIPFSWPNFQDVQRENRSFEALALVQRGDYTLSGLGEAEKVRGALVSSEFFRVLGVPMIQGRPFTADEDRVGAGRVVVIRESLRQRKLAGLADVLGKPITLDGISYTIVGVWPNDVITPTRSEFWLPITPFSTQPNWQRRGNHPGLFAFGRLKPGVTVAQAQADLRAIGERLQKEYPAECAETLPFVVPLLESMVANYRQALWMLLGAVALLLGIACANVGSLQLARTFSRTQEFALRAALGSSRGRLIRQVLVENLILFVIGGSLGAMLAYWSIDTVKAFSPITPRFQNLSVNLNVLLFSLGISVVTGLFFGLWPAFRAARTDLREALQGASKGTVSGSSQWTRQFMVAAQVALTVLLVAGAGLFARSLAQIQNFQFGFDPHNLLVFTASVPESGGAYEKEEARLAFFEQLKSRLQALPGVRSVGQNYSLPLRPMWSTIFDVAGREPYRPGTEPTMEMGVIDSGYFQTLGLPILRGRNFDATDTRASGPKLIIDERMANAIWPGEDPIGKAIYRGRAANRSAQDAAPTEIIGVVPTVALEGIDDVPGNQFQGYLAQSQAAFNELSFVLRTEVPPLSLEKSIRAAVAAIDPNVPIYGVTTMEKRIADHYVTQALYSRLVAFFAGVALLLACLGLHGVVAHAMSTRRRELGIRMALGAMQRQLVLLVLSDGARPLLAGLVLGILSALALGKLIAGLLYRVSPYDTLTLAVTVAALVISGALTLWLPARRAAKIDPMIALRAE